MFWYRKKKNNSIQGIRIRYVNWVITIAESALLLFILFLLFQIYRDNRQLISITNSYITAEEEITGFRDSTDIMTDCVRKYLISHDKADIDAYFEELNKQRRELALEKWLTHFPEGTRKSLVLLQAYQLSEQLRDLEMHSFRIISILEGVSTYKYPKELSQYKLPNMELNLTREQLRNRGYYLVYDTNYTTIKSMISQKIDQANEEYTKYAQGRQNAITESITKNLRLLGITIALLMIDVLFNLLVYRFFFAAPLEEITKRVAEDKPLPIRGAYELKQLEHTYNVAFENSKRNRDYLENQAEHDSLTSLLNRRAYDEICEELSYSENPLAYILIDVDDFKKVNDTLGHEMGDKVLRFVSGVMKEHFRHGDFVFRLGGDEFAVIMNEISPKEKHVIEDKLEDLLMVLKKQSDEGLPVVTLSMGVAFSEKGFQESLYHDADKALYETKKRGKNGFSFFYNTENQ